MTNKKVDSTEKSVMILTSDESRKYEYDSVHASYERHGSIEYYDEIGQAPNIKVLKALGILNE